MDKCQWPISICIEEIAPLDSKYRREGDNNKLPYCTKHLDLAEISKIHKSIWEKSGEVQNYCQCLYCASQVTKPTEIVTLSKSLPTLPQDYPKTSEAYRIRFGKQFRRSKEQMERGLSNEEAYAEFYKEQPEAQEYERIVKEFNIIQEHNKKILPPSFAAYRKKFGKSYKRTSSQIERGLTRQQAYEEFMTNSNGTVKTVATTTRPDLDTSMTIPNTIEEYTSLTGKRFRISQEEISQGLNRQQAFEKFIQRQRDLRK